jgi:hypothetical protein
VTTSEPYHSGVDLLGAVFHLVDPMVRAARAGYGGIPTVGDSEWWAAPADVQLAAVLLVAKAHLLAEQLRAVEGLKGAAARISASGIAWASDFTPYVELAARRAELVTPVRCTHRGCTVVVSVRHPLPNLLTVRCGRHAQPSEAAA